MPREAHLTTGDPKREQEHVAATKLLAIAAGLVREPLAELGHPPVRDPLELVLTLVGL